MLPSKSVWKTWSALEKITYTAQFFASIALIPTVWFSYLGWREARLARADQMDFFLAEKAPRIEISRIYMSSGFLKIDITNSGESEARDIQISTAVATGVSNRFNVSFDQFYQKFAAPLKGRGMVLGKGSTTGIIMTWEDEVKKVLGYAPLDLKMMEEGDRPVFVKGSMMFVVNVFYKDLRQGFRMTTASAMMNPPNYEALLKAQKQEKEEEYAAAVEEFLQENRRQGTGLPSPVH